jgi:putative membrane protein
MSLVPSAAFVQLPLADGFDMHGDFGAGWWIVMMLGMLLFWGLVIAAIVWVVRELSQSRSVHAGIDSPLALLDRRFASGEISAEEYRERRAVLSGESEPPTNPGG